MTERFARQMMPLWAEGEEPVRIMEHREEPRTPFRMRMDEIGNRILKKYGIFMIVMAIWTISIICSSAIVKHNTEKAVRAEMAAEYAVALEQYKAEQREAEQAAHWLSGDASREAAINQDAVRLAKIGQGVMNTYTGADLEDARKVMICALCRVYSGGEFAKIKSISDAVNQENQWWGYDAGMTYTSDVYNVAVEVSGIFHNAEPMPCSSDMVYASWNGQEIVLRNQWEANASARYF